MNLERHRVGQARRTGNGAEGLARSLDRTERPRRAILIPPLLCHTVTQLGFPVNSDCHNVTTEVPAGGNGNGLRALSWVGMELAGLIYLSWSCRVSMPLGKPVPVSVQDYGIRLLPVSTVVRQELGTDLTGGL